MPDDVKEMLGIPVSDDNRKRSKSEPRSQHKMRSKVRLICYYQMFLLHVPFHLIVSSKYR